MGIFEWISVIGIVVSTILSVFSLAGIAYLAGIKFTSLEKDVQYLKETTEGLDERLDLIWHSILRRGIGEAVINQNATWNSPLFVSQTVRQAFHDLIPDLKKLYQSKSWKDDGELGLAIEHKWGEYILRHICIPNQFRSHECITLAIALAKEDFIQPE